jgi:hypothetical protein
LKSSRKEWGNIGKVNEKTLENMEMKLERRSWSKGVGEKEK